MLNSKFQIPNSIILIFLLILGAFTAGFWIFKSSSSSSKDYPLINKAVTENIGKHFIINFRPLRLELERIQKRYPQKTYIYFSYLNNGSWVGLNEREEFTAASTIKVPLAMALLKAIEEGKLKLTDSYSLEELDLNDGFGDLYKVGKDQEFTVEELLKIMLEKSDNTAMNAVFTIFRRIGIENPFERIYGFLGWEFASFIPALGEMPDYSKINLKTLSNLFIALYDVKYVNVEHSQQILEYLANSPFNDRIVAGIPEGITVSHKIGTSTGDKTFSDCGIVYAPNRNYILCVGSNGGDEKVASKFMAEVSGVVYKYVINN